MTKRTERNEYKLIEDRPKTAPTARSLLLMADMREKRQQKERPAYGSWIVLTIITVAVVLMLFFAAAQ